MDIAGITVHPDERWMQQMARNVTMEGCGVLLDCRYLLHDRDTIASGQVEPLVLPARSPNLNAYAERWVRSRSLSTRGLPALRLLHVCNGSCVTSIAGPNGDAKLCER